MDTPKTEPRAALHEPGFYAGKDEIAMRQDLEIEGRNVQRVEDGPNAKYDPHKNPFDLRLAYVSGSASVHVGDEAYECKPGDRLYIPGQIEHWANVSGEGVVYLMVEMDATGDAYGS